MKIPDYCIIELIEDFDHNVNDRKYRKGERFLVKIKYWFQRRVLNL